MTLTIKHVAESLVQRQIGDYGALKESVEAHARPGVGKIVWKG
ncbi:MAG: hypothetical protein WBK08_02215 [Nitrospira sp.]